MTAACPSQKDLRSFSLGDVSSEAFEDIARHVEQCPPCGAVVESLGAEPDELLSQLKHLDEAEGQVALETPPALASAVRRITQMRLRIRRNWSSIPAVTSLADLRGGPTGWGDSRCWPSWASARSATCFGPTTRELDRLVAVKIQRAGRMADAEDIERFHREARSAAQLKHPGIVSLYETGQTEEGVCFLVTEYIDGETLESRLARGRPDFGAAAEQIAQIADALQYAHDHGVIHRDIKPSNILIDTDGRPHIMDFGLAKRESGGRDDDPRRPGDGHAGLHVARAGPGRVAPRRCPQRCLQPGRGALRDAHRRAPVSGKPADAAVAGAGGRAAPAASTERPHPARSGDDLPEGDGEVAGPALRARPATWPTICGGIWHNEPIHARPIGPLERLARGGAAAIRWRPACWWR